MQAIVTTYAGPTDHRGSRCIAKADAGRLTVSWDDALGLEGNHVAAAEALAERLGWLPPYYGPMVTGSLPGAGYVHVFTERVRP